MWSIYYYMIKMRTYVKIPKILAADDHRSVRRAMRKDLSRNYDVETFYGGCDLLSHIAYLAATVISAFEGELGKDDVDIGKRAQSRVELTAQGLWAGSGKPVQGEDGR